MKKTGIIYWIVTGIFSLMMVFSAYMYITAPEAKTSFEHLGFPGYFRIELAVAKFFGALTLLLPFVPKGFKQFAYAGFSINLISATIAHTASGDPVQVISAPLIFLVILAVSYLYYTKLEQAKQ